MKPNLFIVGAPKCGTTAWVQYLRTHPDIFFPDFKEPHHFSSDFHHRVGVPDIDRYLELYDKAGSSKVVGDGSASYLYSTVAAKKIRSFNPSAKIVIFLRQQTDYLLSWHNELLKNGTENVKSFERAWRLSGRRNERNTGRFMREARYLDYKAIGRFHEQIERYYAEFPAEQIRVFSYEEWSRDPRPTYLELMRFLRLQDDQRMDFDPVNAARHVRSVGLFLLISSPPPFVRRSVGLIKKLTGKRHLGWAERLKNFNIKRGYLGAPPSHELLQEIREFFEEDNAKLEQRIWRPSRA